MNLIPLKERFFESINNVLYVFERALIESGISVNYYRKEKSEGKNKRLQFSDHPLDRRFNLIAYETLSDAHKDKLQKRFGNPYNFTTRQPILKLVDHSQENEKLFLNYRVNADPSKLIPIKKVKQYSRACDWLDMLKKVEDSRNKIIKELGIKVPDFYKHIDELMQDEKKNGISETYEGDYQLSAKFPTSYRNLRPKLEEYIAKGPLCLIDKMYGNQQAAKINDEVSEAHLLYIIEDPRQYDDVMTTMLYNTWANSNGKKTITPSTVFNWRKKREYQITGSREGTSMFNDKYIRQVKGLLPSVPLALVEHDDNNLDFLFTDTEGYDFNKYVAIVVIDSRLKLLLGKSYVVGQSPKQWQVQHAYIDAMYYIRSLTGSWYKPFEIKSDKWAIKSMTPYYEKIAKFIPPAHGNKHRGYIEQFFSSPLWKRSQKLVSNNNWSGNNMTAKYRGVNDEALRLNAKNRPMIGNEAELQIENFFHLLRHMPDFKRTDMNAPSKEEQFKLEWSQMHTDDKRPITDEQFLLTFGIKHESRNANGIRITNRGVEPQIANVKYSYDLPETWMYNKYNGAKVNVVYDPFDMSRVLITNDDDIRFLAKTPLLQPRAMKDQYTNSRTFLNAVLAEKKEQVSQVNDSAELRRSLVYGSKFNAEAILQGGVLSKELKNSAEQVFTEKMGKKSLEDMHDQM